MCAFNTLTRYSKNEKLVNTFRILFRNSHAPMFERAVNHLAYVGQQIYGPTGGRGKEAKGRAGLGRVKRMGEERRRLVGAGWGEGDCWELGG